MSELLERLKYVKNAEHEKWRMCSTFTIQHDCCIMDCSPSIELTTKQFNRIIKAVEEKE